MRDLARTALRIAAGVTRDRFEDDEVLRLALVKVIENIGEAARRVSEDGRTRVPLPWNAIVGMRHRLAHDYLNYDRDVIWRVLREELAPLLAEIEAHLSPRE